ncbi:hypothetical protein FP2506_02510 [Fulvimarina pelagi HTCC2506]|uniref:DUF1236 domain-containing protein n=2 Tax=Fulvimarina pelagi TaxID=217511 RepID=Q0FYB8_9HYPH|nr:DUF1236 domain-containing protein [Fulvimarina pelagi]EAU40077.1 hypothetical protein FP2506_02510 [Fulvimarina pelagi HTCC2506]BAT31116.1 hypothetical protein [Fulvimarina pelagi]
MKRLIVAMLASAFVAGPALAQTSTTTTVTETTVVEQPQVEEIRTYVVDQSVESVAAPEGVTISVGTALPEPVPLYKLPEGVAPPTYQYTVVDGQTVLVDENRSIVQIIN